MNDAEPPSSRLESNGRLATYDSRWQYPAITEKHALERIRQAALVIPQDCIYLGFPWATLIDLLDNRPEEAAPLIEALSKLSELTATKSRIVTVCQHIRLLNHQRLFYEAGVTNIFWSHAVVGEHCLPEERSIRLHPFPLYPVQVFSRIESTRDILFSFVGARARQFYLTEARNQILDLLSTDTRGYVRGRSDWHYNKIVYQHQIMNRTSSSDSLVDDDAGREFQDILSRSTFSLCPSGSGPNSIRLWESLGAESIPVILSDTWAPPGERALWEAAAVFCEETPEAIAALPERLFDMANNKELLEEKRHAMRQLWRLYGPSWFTYDIEKLFTVATVASVKEPSDPLPLSADDLAKLATEANESDDEFVLAAFTSRMLLETPSFATTWRNKTGLQTACDAIATRIQEKPAGRIYKKARVRFLSSDIENDTSNAPLRTFRLGSNASRTPLSYKSYGVFFQGLIDETPCAEDAEILIFAASPNILECSHEVLALKKQNPALKVCVLSEEPLWDTTWAHDWGRRNGKLDGLEVDVDYAVFSHSTSDIFHFSMLPYFITTTDDFFVRYARFFARNAEMSPADVLTYWKAAPIRAAFFAEKRTEKRYDFSRPTENLTGLCAYRTRLAQAIGGHGVMRRGKGWENSGARRQDLADWHLDKLQALDLQSFIVSGLENTHWPDYITEKPFDAFAVLGLPIYYASPAHRFHEIVPDTSYLNIYGKTADEAAAIISVFEPDHSFAANYLDAQKRLADLFSNPQTLMKERIRVAQAVHRALMGLRPNEHKA